MAGFTENIKLVVDVVTDKASSSLGTFKSKIADAEGGFGKLKAAGSGAFDFVQSAGPLAFAAVGLGVAKMAEKAVGAFEDTAIAAGKFSDATGLGVEASSKWIEVAGDVGIGADNVQSAMVKMEKAISNNRGAFGDLVATAKDGSVDISETFLNTIEHLRGIKDPIDRANEASKLFGKGFTGVAELIGTSADDLRKRLADVSNQKIITPDELEQARKLRASLDELKDKGEDAALTIGGALAPAVTELADTLVVAADAAGKTLGKLDQLNQQMESQTGFNLFSSSWKIAGELINNIRTGRNPFETIEKESKSAADGVDLVSGALSTQIQSVEDAMAAQEAASTVTAKLGEEARIAASKVAGLGRQFETSTDVINGALGRLDIADQTAHMTDLLKTLHDKAVDAWNASASGAANAKQKQEEFAQATRDTQRELLNLLGRINNLPTSKTTEIVAMIDRGSFDEAARRIAILARNQTMTLSIVTRGGAGFNTTGTPHFQEGGTVPGPKGKPQLAVVHGGEQVIPVDSATALPLGLPAVAATSAVTVNMNGTFIGPDKAALGAWFQDAIAAAQRRGFRAS
jgi:hypothetical protein